MAADPYYAASLSTSLGKWCFSSHSPAKGCNFSTANYKAPSWIYFCSSVSLEVSLRLLKRYPMWWTWRTTRLKIVIIYLFIIKRKNNSYIMTMLRVDEILEITEHQILRRVTSFAKMTATQLMSMLYYVWTPQGKSWEIIHPSCSMRRARSIGTP